MENKIDPQEALDASIIFAKALGLILQDKQGIVIDVPTESKIYEMIKKVVVFKFNDKVHIYKCEDDMVEGTAVLLDTETPDNQE